MHVEKFFFNLLKPSINDKNGQHETPLLCSWLRAGNYCFVNRKTPRDDLDISPTKLKKYIDRNKILRLFLFLSYKLYLFTKKVARN